MKVRGCAKMVLGMLVRMSVLESVRASSHVVVLRWTYVVLL